MRQIAVLSVALVASLVGAYLTWTDEAEEVSDDVTFVYSASESDLQKLRWHSDTLDISVERKKDAQGSYLWVESTETKKPKAKPPAHPGDVEEQDKDKDKDAEKDKDSKAEGPDSEHEPDPPELTPEPAPTDAPATPEPEAPPEVKTTKFMANAQADEMWKSFAPLAALRELGASSADMATFGLDPAAADAPPATTIEVVRGSGPITLTVGGETYGSKDRYVKYQDRVYLVDDATLRPLEFASSRLLERSLFPFQESDIEGVSVELPGGAPPRSWVQQNRDDRAKSYWATAEALDKEDDTGGTWLGKVFKLKLRDYVEDGTVTTPLETVVAYTVTGKGESWRIELLKTTNGEGGTDWYARSTYNRSLVSLTESLVRNVVDDIGSLTPE